MPLGCFFWWYEGPICIVTILRRIFGGRHTFWLVISGFVICDGVCLEVCDDVRVWERAIMRVKVMVPVWVSCYKYRDCVRVVFGCKSCPMKCLLNIVFRMWMSAHVSCPFLLE